MQGRSSARAAMLVAAATLAACSGTTVLGDASGSSGSGGGAQTTSGVAAGPSGTGGSGASTSGTMSSGTMSSGTMSSGTGGNGTGGSGTGTSGTGGASAGNACGDAKDQGILAQHKDLTLQEAVCYNSGSTVSCLQASLGLTEGCAACYANGFICFVNACGPSCATAGLNAMCQACFDASCKPAQVACSGPVPG